MKKSDTAKILQILQTAYPHIYKSGTTEQTEATIDLYYSIFGEYPLELVLSALKNYIRTNDNYPSIAGIQKQIDILSGKQTPAELWTILEKAISRSAYNYVCEFEKLPDSIKAWLGEPVTLHKLGQQDIQTTQGVTRGQFLKTIESITAKQKALDSLPNEIKNEIKQLGNKMQL